MAYLSTVFCNIFKVFRDARYGYKKGKDGRLEVDPEAAKVVKMIFRMAAEGTSFADITRELNGQAIATCDEQKLSRGDQVQFQRFDTIKKKHWSPTTVAAIVRDEIYIGTRIWGKHVAVCIPVIKQF